MNTLFQFIQILTKPAKHFRNLKQNDLTRAKSFSFYLFFVIVSFGTVFIWGFLQYFFDKPNTGFLDSALLISLTPSFIILFLLLLAPIIYSTTLLSILKHKGLNSDKELVFIAALRSLSIIPFYITLLSLFLISVMLFFPSLEISSTILIYTVLSTIILSIFHTGSTTAKAINTITNLKQESVLRIAITSVLITFLIFLLILGTIVSILYAIALILLLFGILTYF